MTASFLYAASRTPFGRFGGALAAVRPDDLAAIALSGVLAKAPNSTPLTSAMSCGAMRTAPARTTAT
jgi:acetyl-CoA acetyltransferase